MDTSEFIGDLPQPDISATVIDRIKYLLKLIRKNQAQFSELIGLNPSNISKALSGKIPVSESMINRIVVNIGVSKKWLVSGTDVPFPKYEGPNTIAAGGRLTPNQLKGAPVYDIDVAAGTDNLSRMFTAEHIIGHLAIPGLNSELPIVKVSGNSMTPKIQNGGYISIRPVQLDAPIFWGQIYVVVLEDYRMVKYVRRHPDPEKVILHSENPDFDDVIIDRSSILGLFQVESILNYEIVG